MNRVALKVVSHANNTDSWGHIKYEQLVGALELRVCTGWIKLRLILIHYDNLASVFP